jgi:hypothetical protein
MLTAWLRRLAFGLVLISASCAVMSPETARAPLANPMFVTANSADPNAELTVSERVVDVLHKYNFEVDSTNQLERTIATQYKVGSSVLEPWHKESVGCDNRLESTFQSIRRKALVHLVPVDGGYLVSIEAFKEIEDLTGPAANTAGGATFLDNYPLQRDLNLVVGQSSPSGWIPLGRDLALEQDMIRRLQGAFSR